MTTLETYRSARERIVSSCRNLSLRGFLAGIGGNMAFRVSEHEFLVTPSGTDYSEMQWEDICVLDLHTLRKVDGRLSPSVESGLHATLFRGRPELKASIHTHQPIASAAALLADSIPCHTSEERASLGLEVRVAPYGPSGTRLLVRALTRTLRPDINAYLLQSHGVIAAARTMEDAMRAVELVEMAASRHLKNLIHQNMELPDELKLRVLSAIHG